MDPLDKFPMVYGVWRHHFYTSTRGVSSREILLCVCQLKVYLIRTINLNKIVLDVIVSAPGDDRYKLTLEWH